MNADYQKLPKASLLASAQEVWTEPILAHLYNAVIESIFFFLSLLPVKYQCVEKKYLETVVKHVSTIIGGDLLYIESIDSM